MLHEKMVNNVSIKLERYDTQVIGTYLYGDRKV